MHPWRAPVDQVTWTKDGCLVYVSQPEKAPIIWAINLGFKRLINHKSIDDWCVLVNEYNF